VSLATRSGVFALALGLYLGAGSATLHGQAKSALSPSSRQGPTRPARAKPSTSKAGAAPAAETAEKQLAQLARVLRDESSAQTYARLGEFATRNARNELGARAALALGYYDYSKNRLAQAQQWLERALKLPPGVAREFELREYVLYWQAQVNRALGREVPALVQLEALRREFPDSVMTEPALQALGSSALALGRAEEALGALDGYDKTPVRPALLLLRAQAREKAGEGNRAAAARDYQTLYCRFPLSDESRLAGERLAALQAALGAEFPEAPLEAQVTRASLLFDARRWREARAEYERLLPRLMAPTVGLERLRTQLRLAQIRGQLGEGPAALAELGLSDPDLDAERRYALAQSWRAQKQEAEMLKAVEELAARYPQSRWTEEGLFAAGNYFWVNLDRERAASFYRRVAQQFPQGKNVQAAQWRLAWVAYLQRRPEATGLLEEHIRRFPGSSYTVDALYWLGRSAERDANAAHARSFYIKAQQRFPQTYFGRQSAERLRLIGTAPVNFADFLALIPAPPPLPSVEQAVPPVAAGRWARAQALCTIAFDASAELELRAAYVATGSARLLWEAAQAADEAGQHPVAIGLVRQLYPQLEARQFHEVPLDAWQTLFPLPYKRSLKRAAARNHLDPMLVAGVIRQESSFVPDAVSHAGAVGLMQVLPRTGQKLARQLKLRYARARLFDPEYNLLLGTLYLAELVQTQGSPEAALSAFNAGEERVAAWKSERNYEETPEFVESIPFTETREYVQIVMRNAEMYRRLYEQPR